MDSEKNNISIRAVNKEGTSIPVIIRLNEYSERDTFDYQIKPHDPTLGIAIGVMLSIICIIVFMFIMIKHRNCSKNPPGPNQMATTSNRSHPPAQTCTFDMHEMQTLIGQPIETTVVLPVNGVGKHCKNGNGTAGDALLPVENDNNSVNVVFTSTPKKNSNGLNTIETDDVPVIISMVFISIWFFKSNTIKIFIIFVIIYLRPIKHRTKVLHRIQIIVRWKI